MKNTLKEKPKPINKFSDKFTLTLWNWMQKTEIIDDKFKMNKEKMYIEYKKSKFIFLFLINCILGSFEDDLL